jgi:hypothetical protein
MNKLLENGLWFLLLSSACIQGSFTHREALHMLYVVQIITWNVSELLNIAYV